MEGTEVIEEFDERIVGRHTQENNYPPRNR